MMREKGWEVGDPLPFRQSTAPTQNSLGVRTSSSSSSPTLGTFNTSILLTTIPISTLRSNNLTSHHICTAQ